MLHRCRDVPLLQMVGSGQSIRTDLLQPDGQAAVLQLIAGIEGRPSDALERRRQYELPCRLNVIESSRWNAVERRLNVYRVGEDVDKRPLVDASHTTGNHESRLCQSKERAALHDFQSVGQLQIEHPVIVQRCISDML